MTEVTLGTEYGLTKKARFITMECNDQDKFIRVFYREILVANDGTVVKEGDVKTYELRDKAAVLDGEGVVITPAVTDFSDWDTNLGATIRPAIQNRLKTIYGIE